MDINSELSYLSMSLGLHSFGCAPVKAYASAPQGGRPEEILPGAKTVITFAYRLNSGAIDYLPGTRNRYMDEYAAVNQILAMAAHKITRLMEDRGYTSAGIGPQAETGGRDSLADFSHRRSAVLCGLGTLGINNLLLVKKHGPRVMLASVITAAELKHSSPIQENLCSGCGECVSRCPAGALSGWEGNYSPHEGRLIDRERCDRYMFADCGGKRCGLCMAVCPAAVK